MSNDIWKCNKCNKKERIIMNGLCVFCWHGKNKKGELENE